MAQMFLLEAPSHHIFYNVSISQLHNMLHEMPAWGKLLENLITISDNWNAVEEMKGLIRGSWIFVTQVVSVSAVRRHVRWKKPRKSRTSRDEGNEKYTERDEWMGEIKALMLTKADCDSAAMTSLSFLSPRGQEMSHTKSEVVKVRRTKHKFYTNTCTHPLVCLAFPFWWYIWCLSSSNKGIVFMLVILFKFQE